MPRVTLFLTLLPRLHDRFPYARWRGCPRGAIRSPGAVPTAPADLIVTNARVYTADDARPLVEAFAVRDGRITFVGSQREAAVLAGPATRIVDAGGRTVIPGMVDAHAHFSGLAQTLRQVDLTGTTSLAEVIARVVAKAQTVPKGTWITGRGWDQNDWGITDFPTHDALSAALPDHPVLLERVDGHATYANMAAMKAAGVTAASKAPVGGQIITDTRGQPTGVFIDNASDVLERQVPAPTAAELTSALKDAIALMHRWGRKHPWLPATHTRGTRHQRHTCIPIYCACCILCDPVTL